MGWSQQIYEVYKNNETKVFAIYDYLKSKLFHF